MFDGTLMVAAMVLGVLVIDALARPRLAGLRSLQGSGLAALVALVALGTALMITGALTSSVMLVLAVGGLFCLVSNIKTRVLGEPLVFTDFALIGAVFQHPQFYVSALRVWQIGLIVAGFALTLVMLVWLSTPDLPPRLAGLFLVLGAGAALALLLRAECWADMAARPDAADDVRAHGLIAVLVVHWLKWRALCDPPACDAAKPLGQGDPLVIIVQCESFTDPADLFGAAAPVLPGLAHARAKALQWGKLLAPGFGAYTMRTEYGVLFGRSEEELGLRKFDPFLTALGEASFCLANRLHPDQWHRLFVHPHDLGFYGRDRLMVAAGFDAMIGLEAFDPPRPGEGRYVSDAAVVSKIEELAAKSRSASLIYAVTIENHGPWPTDKNAASGDSGTQYLRLLQRSDAMLSRLLDLAMNAGRPVILCFFGDHRPSIPHISEPGAERHTPYVLLRVGADGVPLYTADAEKDLTPAQLHHAILSVIKSTIGHG